MALKVLAAVFLVIESVIVVAALAKDKSERGNTMQRSAAQVIHKMVPFPMNWIFHLLAIVSIVVLLG